MVKSVNLIDLLDKFTGFGDILGPKEIQILNDADILLKGTLPIDEPGRLAYLSRNAQIQSELNNLLSRVSYIQNQAELEKNFYWGGLLREEEYEGKDKFTIALSQDSKLFDMVRTINALDVIKSHVNNLYWTAKTIMSRI